MGVESCPFHFRGEPVTITLSSGLTAFATGDNGEAAFARADQALYKAKREGANASSWAGGGGQPARFGAALGAG